MRQSSRERSPRDPRTSCNGHRNMPRMANSSKERQMASLTRRGQSKATGALILGDLASAMTLANRTSNANPRSLSGAVASSGPNDSRCRSWRSTDALLKTLKMSQPPSLKVRHSPAAGTRWSSTTSPRQLTQDSPSTLPTTRSTLRANSCCGISKQGLHLRTTWASQLIAQ